MIDFGNPGRPLGHSVLYQQQQTDDAAPQCISGRTSYLRVRLAFHPYPQLIQAVFNRHWFGRPQALTPASPWPWVDHAVSGLLLATLGSLLGRAVRTRFRSGFPAERVNPPPTVTRRFILQKARHHQAYSPALTVCRRSGFRFYFTPLPGFFSPFPHGTGALSVAKRI